ncbi:MAG: FKBP-type peptidyl-prolyl cis-trans isomerase [Sphingomonas sp.]|nr:FKBP-type peptidyl-prolyl cis-trans isomerase [Sphingomonas sp.]
MKKIVLSVLTLSLMTACATAPTEPMTVAGPDFLTRNAAVKRVATTASGLQYYVLKSGPKTGRSPVDGDTVTFDYEGKLTTGETFDSSFARGTPLTGGVGDFVPGFTEALKLMKPGDEWIVWIPPALGYGERATGSIPANSVLRFKMALRSVAPAAVPTP